MEIDNACYKAGCPTICATSTLVTQTEILQCVLQTVMRYHVSYKMPCNPNGDPIMCVTMSGGLQ
eukprot:3597772-Pleurochrysis_carterae.AAC.1